MIASSTLVLEDRPPELLLLGNHLQQDVAGDVMPGLVLDHLDLLALDDQRADVVERDVPALRCVVETTIRVLLDQAFLRHPRECTSVVATHDMRAGPASDSSQRFFAAQQTPWSLAVVGRRLAA